jgi:hypothetical protein
LRANVAPIVRSQRNYWVDIWGFASKKGNEVSNLLLSEQRCHAVRSEVAQYAQHVNFKINKPLGEEESEGGEHDNWGKWRRVEIYVFAGPPPPNFKPVPVKPRPKPGSIKAPAGCWCIIGVDAEGMPLKALVTGGFVKITLLNDKGEKYLISGTGGGTGFGPGISPENFGPFGKKLMDELKARKLIGPGETTGPVLKRLTWAANLTIQEIVHSGWFLISNAEAQGVVGGGEMGVIFFGSPISPPPAYVVSGEPWGFYTSTSLGTPKAAGSVSAIQYKITEWKKIN